jgi:hypothetical protein
MASTAATTKPSAGRAARLAAPLLLACWAALLATLAAPRLVAAIVRVPGDAGVALMERDARVPVDVLDAVIDSRNAAETWINSGRNLNERGLAAMRLLSAMEALPSRQAAEERRYLDLAVASLEAGLSRQPAQPYAWLQLAIALLKRGDEPARAERAWRMAVETGPNEPALIVPRVALGLVLWDRAGARTRRMLAQEIERAAAAQPRALARLSLQLGVGEFVRAVLDGKPALLAAFDEMAAMPEEGPPLFR